MKKNTKVTIITPSFNQGQFIEETILSILNQTYKNIEYIVVDGGSTDNTMEIIEKYRDKIDIIIHEKDKGQADAINKGFKLAKGELLGWINSDDVLYPDCVKKIVDLYNQNPDGVIYYCSSLDWINKSGVYIKTVQLKIKNRDHLLNKNYSLIQQGSFYTKMSLEKVNYLNENIYYCMDLDLWLRLLKYGKVYYLDERSFCAFRIHSGTKTDTGKSKFLKNIKQVLIAQNANYFSTNMFKLYLYFLKCYFKSYYERFIK